MALVKCPECGRERVSDTAEACPDCGYNVRAHYERVKEENEKRMEEEEKTDTEKEQLSKEEQPSMEEQPSKEERASEEESVLNAEKESEEEKTLEKETASKEESISERQNERMESGRYLENGMQIQQKDIVIMSILGIITILLLVGIVCYTNIKASNSEKQEYCFLPSVEIQDNSSEREFLEAILKCKVQHEELNNIIKKDFKYEEDKRSKLQKVLKENYEKRIKEIVDGYNGTLEYSITDIRESIENNTFYFTIIEKYYDKGNYQDCFDNYLNYFSKTYIEDCSYYIVKILYPETFSEGIKEQLANVGVRAWGDDGREMLNEVITYINSTPEGGDAYASLISDARKQLDEKNKETGEDKRSASKKRNPAIGMTAEEVLESTWGRPKKINKTTYSWGVTEQWCYSGYRYIYFDNGIVSSISE